MKPEVMTVGNNVKIHLYDANGNTLRYYENVPRHGVDNGVLYMLTDTQRISFRGVFLVEEDK
jgi:hypothetical protein